MKSVKRMLMANTSPTGSLDVDAFQRAMLIYRNSIDPETKASPAMILFGRPIRDPIPTPLGRYCPHPTWQETTVNREKALAKRHSREREKWEEHTKQLKPLEIGDHVYLQNLSGNYPLRWERTGTVVEIKPFKQYTVKVDGTGRVTLRNRRHLRKFTPILQEIKCSPPVVIREHTGANNPMSTPVNIQGPGSPPKKRVTQPLTIRQQETTNHTIPLDQPEPTTPDRESAFETATPAQEQPEQRSETENTQNVLPTQSATQTPVNIKKVPLALRRLLPANKPGKLE